MLLCQQPGNDSLNKGRRFVLFLAKPKKILFVCTGNTCRSPMAEAIFRKMTEEADHQWLIDSAGIHAATGARATFEAVEVLKGLKLDVSGHSARQLTAEILEDADLVLTMTVSHKRSIQMEFPSVAAKVFTIKEYAGKTEELDIHDPYGCGLEVYQRVANELQADLALIWKRLAAEREAN
ncbi:MAG: low molecular weight protein arginine phosphatase [Firmicutes bacterium]|jgi:protein-tyrosine-phosphatase|nr:low molecular weight protein arginine phosphatase [Bacillota bacterium]